MALSLGPANAVRGALVDNSAANDWRCAKMALAVRLLPELFVRAVEIQTQEAHAGNGYANSATTERWTTAQFPKTTLATFFCCL